MVGITTLQMFCNVVIKHIKSIRLTTFVHRVLEYMFGMCMVHFILLELPSMPKGEIDELQLIWNLIEESMIKDN